MSWSLITTGLLALLTGAACGAIFGWMKLPVPAPPTIPGLLGIIGLWAGYTLIHR